MKTDFKFLLPLVVWFAFIVHHRTFARPQPGDMNILNVENCPRGCRCDESTFEIQCRNVDFSKGDFYRLPPWVRTLTLSRASIPTLFDRSFVTLRNLTSLTIQNSEIQNLQPNALMALTKLETLRLPSNQIEQVPRLFFAPTPNLRQISFSDNLIKEFPNGIFDFCPMLDSLRMDQNNLRTLPGQNFQKLLYLRELLVSSNLLQEIPANFIMSESLQLIDVSFNSIRFISPDAFVSLPQLANLKMSHNLITHINPVALLAAKSLNHVALDHNPFICDCQLAPLHAYWSSKFKSTLEQLLESNNELSNTSPTCAWPSSLEGTQIDKLASVDFECTTTTTTTTTTSTTSTTTEKAHTVTQKPVVKIASSVDQRIENDVEPTLVASTKVVSMEQVETSEESNSSSNGFMPPLEVIVATVSAVVVLILTLSTVLCILCYK